MFPDIANDVLGKQNNKDDDSHNLEDDASNGDPHAASISTRTLYKCLGNEGDKDAEDEEPDEELRVQVEQGTVEVVDPCGLGSASSRGNKGVQMGPRRLGEQHINCRTKEYGCSGDAD